jgi:LysR family transcriptional regulator, glycine cleavage system transcriptional activator
MIRMVRKLPPLSALRAFEAAARHLSFTRAADELGVTPAAISHQVRNLEEQLGIPLFQRLTRAVRLTDAGQAFQPLLSDGFERLAAAVAVLQATERAGILTVSVAPSFAGKWLVPRIERFAALHPEIDLRISASMALVDFRSDQVDVAIRFGQGRYPGLKVDKLFSESVTPLCSPAFTQGPHPLRTPEDLRHHTLLHDDSAYAVGPTPDWRMWLKLAGHEDVDARRGLRFSHAEHALQAACDGLGVVLGRQSLAAGDIAAGRLVRPFHLVLPIDFGYFLVRPEAGEERPKVAAFREWILGEARQDEQTAAAAPGAA